MDIRIHRDSPVPLYRQIVEQVREQILAERLPDGFLLPPERRLADSLGLNRSTVLAAYRELRADGWVESRVGSGTRVRGRAEREPMPHVASSALWRVLGSAGLEQGVDSLLRDLMALAGREGVIHFGSGYADPELVPMDLLGPILEDIATRRDTKPFLVSPTEGLTSLREALSAHLVKRGIRCGPGELLVCSGSQQGLDLVARTLLNPGDLVLVEEPTYVGALQIFQLAQARILSVPVDEDGLRVDLLEAILARQRPKLLYVTPAFQNPSGCTLSLPRRMRLLDLVARYQVPVLEDDPFSELRYEGANLPSLKALDESGHVIHLSTLSKLLFPGFRVGWIAAERTLVSRLALLKQSADLHTNTFGQCVMDEVLRRDVLARHLDRIRPVYAGKRDALLEALAAARIPGMTWIRPQGGFFLWCRLGERRSTRRLLERGIEARVTFLPGDSCYVAEPKASCLRLGFSSVSLAQIPEGVRRLARVLKGVGEGPLARTQPIV